MSRTRAGIVSPRGRLREELEADLIAAHQRAPVLPVEVLTLPCAMVVVGATGEASLVLYQGHQAVAFPAGSDTFCQWNHFLNDYNGQGIACDLTWSADADTGTVDWSLGWSTLNSGELSTLTYQELPQTVTVPVVSDYLTQTRIFLPVTSMIQEGKLLCLRLTRKGTTDSCTGTVHLILARLAYPSNN